MLLLLTGLWSSLVPSFHPARPVGDRHVSIRLAVNLHLYTVGIIHLQIILSYKVHAQQIALPIPIQTRYLESFLPALQNVSQSTSFFEKLFYCFWWGLQNLRFAKKNQLPVFFSCLCTFIYWFIYCSSLGQNMKTSTNTLENLFAVFVSTSGLVLFALLIGNVQVQTLFWHC